MWMMRWRGDEALEGSTWWWVGPWYILVVRFLEIVRLILIKLRIVREFLINPQKPQSTNQFESQHRQILLLRILKNPLTQLEVRASPLL